MSESTRYESAPEWHYSDDAAEPNERAWTVRPRIGGGITLVSLDETGAERQKLGIMRDGTNIVVELPAPPDLSRVPELELMAPIIAAASRLRSLGYGPLPPVCVHTDAAKRFWPLFEAKMGPMPESGAASVAGVNVVWSKAFDFMAAPPP